MRIYNLEERTYQFALRIRAFVKRIQKTIHNAEDCKQLIRSSGSVGANFIEAIDSIGEKDTLYRYRICRKEAKESQYWLKLIDLGGMVSLSDEKTALIQEAYELTCIFGSLVYKK